MNLSLLLLTLLLHTTYVHTHPPIHTNIHLQTHTQTYTNTLPPIQVYDEKWTLVGEYANAQDVIDGKYYRTGTCTMKLTVWEPWTPIITSLLSAAQNYVLTQQQQNVSMCVEYWVMTWDEVGEKEVCKHNKDCPDIIIIGTTQVSARVAAREVASLQDYFESYTYNTGIVLEDDFLRPYFYEFYFHDEWYALPLVTDTRALYFNKTTFDRLGLMYPPPYGNWSKPYSKSWTWDVFSDYALNISSLSGPNNAFQFYGCFDEEFKLMAMIAQSYNVQLLYKANNTCGLRSPRFIQALNDTAERWLHVDKSMNPYFASTDLDAIYSWQHTNYENPLDQPIFPGVCPPSSEGNFSLFGMMIDTSSLEIAAPNVTSNNSILMAYPPGQKTFLGGAGLVITSGSTQKDDAWDFIAFLVNSQNEWIDTINMDQHSCPPYQSALDMEQYTQDEWKIRSDLLTFAVPSQYPLPSFPQYAKLEALKPIRSMWMEIAFKNYTIEENVERACVIIDNIFLPDCHYDAKLKMCLLFPFTAPISVLFISLTCVLVAIAIGLLIMFGIHRREPPIRKSSWKFCNIIILASISAYMFVFLSIGQRTDTTCKMRIWCLMFGFVLAYGSISLKLYRVQAIFHSSIGQTLNLKMTDRKIALYLVLITLVDVVLMTVWAYLPRSGALPYTEYVEFYGPAPFYRCSRGNDIILGLLITYNLCVALWGCYLCWKARDVPSQYNEKKFIVYSLLSVVFCCPIILPMVFIFPNRYWGNIMSMIGVMLATTIALWVFCFPKLAQIYYPVPTESNTPTTLGGGRGVGGGVSGIVVDHNASPRGTVRVKSVKSMKRYSNKTEVPDHVEIELDVDTSLDKIEYTSTPQPPPQQPQQTPAQNRHSYSTTSSTSPSPSAVHS